MSSDAENTNPEQQQVRQIQVDDTKALASYANFCRVTGTPEELIIDFALNPQPMGIPDNAINITQRIVTNFFTASVCGLHSVCRSNVTNKHSASWKLTCKNALFQVPSVVQPKASHLNQTQHQRCSMAVLI